MSPMMISIMCCEFMCFWAQNNIELVFVIVGGRDGIDMWESFSCVPMLGHQVDKGGG